MADNDYSQDLQRRKVMKSLGVAGGAMATGTFAFSGSAAAAEEKGEIDTSDWEVDLDVTDGEVLDKEIYVGKNKTTELDTDSIAFRTQNVDDDGVTTQGWSVGTSATLLTWDIPYHLPIVGGSTVSLSASVSVSLTEFSISLDVCIDGNACISIGGVNVGIGDGRVDADIRGSFYGVPFTLEGSVGYDVSVDPFKLEASVALTPTVQLCLGRDFCDEDASGWRRIGCALCLTLSASIGFTLS